MDGHSYVNQNRQQNENKLVNKNTLSNLLSVHVSEENVLLLVHIQHLVLKKFLKFAYVGEKLS